MKARRATKWIRVIIGVLPSLGPLGEEEFPRDFQLRSLDQGHDRDSIITRELVSGERAGPEFTAAHERTIAWVLEGDELSLRVSFAGPRRPGGRWALRSV